MKLEQQVTSLKLSQKLKELGVKQESLYWWNEDKKLYLRFDKAMVSVEQQVLMKKSVFGDSDWYSAFTVAELGEMLPEHMRSWKDSDGYWDCDTEPKLISGNDTEANARAKMLIYLIENQLIYLS